MLLSQGSRTERRNRQQAGQSLVEMAFVFVLFFLLLIGVLEFGRAVWTYNTIIQSTREGARWAVTNARATYNLGTYTVNGADLTAVKNIVAYGSPGGTEPIVPGINPGMVNVSISAVDVDPAGTPINSKVSVSVSGYQFRFLVPIAPTITIPAYETSLYTEALGRTS